MDAPVHLALGSTSPAKRAAVERVAASFFTRWRLDLVAVPSGVAPQPWGDAETARGAWERAGHALEQTGATFGVGIESGVADGPFGRLYVVSWAVTLDRTGHVGIGGAERFPLPEPLAARVRAGEELGQVLASTRWREAGKRMQGAVALVTGGRRERVDVLEIAVLHAFSDLLQLVAQQPDYP